MITHIVMLNHIEDVFNKLSNSDFNFVMNEMESEVVEREVNATGFLTGLVLTNLHRRSIIPEGGAIGLSMLVGAFLAEQKFSNKQLSLEFK